MMARPPRLPLILFGLLLALCVVLALAFVIEEVPFEDVPSAARGGVERVYTGHGTAHSRFPSMHHGGAGPERHRPILCSGSPGVSGCCSWRSSWAVWRSA